MHESGEWPGTIKHCSGGSYLLEHQTKANRKFAVPRVDMRARPEFRDKVVSFKTHVANDFHGRSKRKEYRYCAAPHTACVGQAAAQVACPVAVDAEEQYAWQVAAHAA